MHDMQECVRASTRKPITRLGLMLANTYRTTEPFDAEQSGVNQLRSWN
jgi:hypothetical protein